MEWYIAYANKPPKTLNDGRLEGSERSFAVATIILCIHLCCAHAQRCGQRIRAREKSFHCHSSENLQVPAAQLERIQLLLRKSGHPQTSKTLLPPRCHLCNTKAILQTVCDGGEALLCLYDLEKVYDSVEYSILLNAVYNAGINGKALRVISHL